MSVPGSLGTADNTTISGMRVMGIAVHIPSRGRPAADVVVLEGSWGAVTHQTTFELTSAHDDLPAVLRDLAAGLSSRLSGLAVDRVVVKRADKPARPNNYLGPKTRLLAEGAITATARATVDHVVLADGKDLAAACPVANKAALIAEARRAVPGAPEDAAAAALAGLVP
jgi:hypothetical protein